MIIEADQALSLVLLPIADVRGELFDAQSADEALGCGHAPTPVIFS